MTDPLPNLSRTANPDRLYGELRLLVPVEVLAVIDGSRSADAADSGIDKTRAAKVNEILSWWARREQRRASFVMNVSRGNPSVMDSELDARL